MEASTPEGRAAPVLQPGVNVWRIERAARFAYFRDVAGCFGAMRASMRRAKHSITIIGWDIDSRTRLVGCSGDASDGLPAELGGFLSPNKDIPESSYPDDVTQDLAKRIVDAGDNVRFDMSDLAPAAFGGTKGAGEWKDLQDFLADPKNVDGIMQRLEANAAKAYGK